MQETVPSATRTGLGLSAEKALRFDFLDFGQIRKHLPHKPIQLGAARSY